MLSETLCNIASLLIVSRCIASRRANVRSGPQSVQETEAGQTGVLVTTHSPPPEKLPLHSLRFSSQLKLTRSHPKDVLFWFFFELWHKLLHLSAWPQPGGGHLRHIPYEPPYRDPCATAGARLISRSFSGLQKGPQKGPKMGLRMDLQRGRKRTPKGTQNKDLKGGFQRFVFRKIVQYRTASLRIRLHRIASRSRLIRTTKRSRNRSKADRSTCYNALPP